MSSAAAQPSLMDDEDFLTELEKFDQPNVPAPPHAFEADELTAVAWANRPTFVDDAPELAPVMPVADEWSTGQRLLSVVGFVLLMCIGAAGAAYMFRDRLALLLR